MLLHLSDELLDERVALQQMVEFQDGAFAEQPIVQLQAGEAVRGLDSYSARSITGSERPNHCMR